MQTMIEVEKLVKSYGNHTVIKGISFSVKEGEIFGLLGANGAGKTTTLECIEGIRGYDSGAIRVHEKIGVQLQSTSLPATITAYEAFKFFCKWNKVPENLELFEVFGLDALKHKQYRSMSTGQKRRLHLALALINDAKIIFLDEPTAGLDVEGRVSLHKEIRKLKEQGKTIIMASHDMAEVESLCDKIVIIKDGNIAFDGYSKELTSTKLKDNVIHIKTSRPLEATEHRYSLPSGTDQGYQIYISEKIGDALLELLNIAKSTENEVLDIKIERETLEQRFMEIAKEGRAE